VRIGEEIGVFGLGF